MLYSSTVLARNASSILAHISRLPAELAYHPLLFTLSTNAPASSLSPLVSALSALSSSGSVGCLSAPLTQPTTSTATATTATTTTNTAAPIACSLAFFRKDHAVPFRSDIPGRPETQVGRWHAMRKKGENDEESQGGEVGLTAEESLKDVDWETIWDRSLKGSEVPPALRGLRKQDVHTVITLTDNAPQGFNESLSSFPLATKLGLFCSSTPFVTGRPYTLIYNGSAYSTGAVGIALSAGPRPALQTAYPGLRAISPSLTVTASEGNLILELDKGNPVALLVSAIEESVLLGKAAKDDEFYLGVLRDGDGELSQVHHITSGGPSRGIMALETETAPGEGTTVQLFHRPSDVSAPFALPHAAKNTLTFVAAPQFDSIPAEEKGDGAVTVLDDVFVAASENGFMLGREGEKTWTCVAPGSQTRLAW